MQRLARRIPIVVALFVLVVAGILVARSRAVRVEPLGPPPSPADLSIKEVELQEDTADGHWRLKADQASVFDAEGRTALRNVTVRVQRGNRGWTIVGEEGDLFKATNNLEVRRNVVLTSSDGLRLETTVLRWKSDEQRLWTDVPVTIFREGVVVRGSALDVLMGDEITTVQGRVHATFGRAASP